MDYWDNSKNPRPPEPKNNYKLWAAAAIGLIAASVYFTSTAPVETYAIPGAVIGRLNDIARSDIDRLKTEPCNRKVAENLLGYMMNSAEYSASLSFIKFTEKQCGFNKDFLPIVFLAQKSLSDYAGAEETTGKLLEEHPAAPEIYIWRAEIKENRGNLQGAYEDMKKGLSLFADPSRVIAKVFYDLANLAIKINQPCEAVAILQDYITLDNVAHRTPQAMSLIKEWREKGSCPEPFGKGTVRMHYNPGLPSIIMPVEINGVQGRMIIDTGASKTVLTKSFAQKTGIKPENGQSEMVITANGNTRQMLGRAKKIALGDAKASNVPVYIQISEQQNFGRNIDGLLGLSFLGNFKFSISKGVLELQSLE